MPRAKIPYDKIDQFLKTQYPKPTFHSIHRTPHTPKRVYVRQNGRYEAAGWRVRITGFRFISLTFDAIQWHTGELVEYEYFSQIVTIWIA